VPNQIHGFKLFRNVEPELYFYKGKKENPRGKKESWGWDEKFPTMMGHTPNTALLQFVVFLFLFTIRKTCLDKDYNDT
jgi:hypothetical protein